MEAEIPYDGTSQLFQLTYRTLVEVEKANQKLTLLAEAVENLQGAVKEVQ